MNAIKISLVQSQIFWEDSSKNIKNLNKKVDTIENTDIIILPEMFNTGFSMNTADVWQDMGGETVSWMRETAKKKNCAICGSLIIKENGKFFNRFIWVDEKGNIETYDKRHLFSMADENSHFEEGKNNITIEYKAWKIRPLICYDLRFPVWSRNKKENESYEYDILIYVANWPLIRKDAWEKLLFARAIENQAYVAGVNGVGADGNGMDYAGSSAIIDMIGELLSNDFTREERIIEKVLDYEKLMAFRKKFPVLNDADAFQL